MPSSTARLVHPPARTVAASATARPSAWDAPWNDEQSLLSSITVDYGPPEPIARLFLKAETAAREAGVRLSFAPLEALADINQQHRDSWRPLLPLFMPGLGGVTPETGFCILGRNRAGEVVATQAARLYTWTDTNFKAEAESLRLFYRDPARAQPGEACRVTATSAEQIYGRIAFSGAVWFRPDYRNRGLQYNLPRLSRVLAFTRWYTDITLSIMAESVARAGAAERAGYRNVDWDVQLTNSPVGTVRCALIWMPQEHLLEDLVS